jgi:hypothetical protein
MKICLIRQPAGLGDILFCQKIARKIVEKYNVDVVWPVIPQFSFISEYINADNILFINENYDFPYKSTYLSGCTRVISNDKLIYIPLQSADQVFPQLRIMESKYKLAGLDISEWPSYCTFDRNKIKENILYYNILGLSDEEKYVVVNSLFGSPPHSKNIENINTTGKYHKVVELTYIDGYNPFDWCGVFERASEIHTVDTCFQYMFETINLNTTDINVYSRVRAPSDPSFTQTQWLFNKQYNWIHN